MYSEVFAGSALEFGFGASKDTPTLQEYTEDFVEAGIDQPYLFCDAIKQSGLKEKKIMDFKTGTTTLGFITKDGVILAVDSRATMGAHISSETVKKVIEISKMKLSTIAGGAADCQYWQAWLAQEVRLYELKNGKEPSVAATSRIMVNLINHYKRYGLSMGMMLAGYDGDQPSLYYIDTEGSRIKGHMFSVGSGMTYAYGILDSFYRYDMSLEDAFELGRRAIMHATHRDAASGGFARVYHVHKHGHTEIVAGDDVNKLYYMYQKQQGLEQEHETGKL